MAHTQQMDGDARNDANELSGAQVLIRKVAAFAFIGLATYALNARRSEIVDWASHASDVRGIGTVRVPAAAASTAKRESAAPAAAAEKEPWVGVLLTPTIELSARHDARLLKVHARVGDMVRAGDVLAEIDTTQLQHELAAAQASLKASQAETWQASVARAQANDRRARREGVVRFGSVALPIVSAEERAGAKFELQSASGRVSAAAASAEERLARVAQLRAMLDEAVLRAPFDGVVAMRFLEQGAYARGGAPILRVVSRGALRARFAVPEQEVRSVALGGRVSFVWDDRRLEGQIDRVAPELDAATSMLFVEATVTGSGASIDPALPGRLVKVFPQGAR